MLVLFIEFLDGMCQSRQCVFEFCEQDDELLPVVCPGFDDLVQEESGGGGPRAICGK